MRDSDRKVLTIAAGKTSPGIPCRGSKVFVETCSFPFILALGGGNQNIVKSGTEIDLDEETFDNLTIINPNTTVDLKLVIWIGTARVNFNYAAVPGTMLVVSSGLFTVALTLPSPLSNPVTVGTSASFPGVATTAVKYSTRGVGEGSRRKQFVVSNRYTTLDIFITDSNGYTLGICQPNDDYTLETDSDFKLWGTVAATGYYVAEIFYL